MSHAFLFHLIWSLLQVGLLYTFGIPPSPSPFPSYNNCLWMNVCAYEWLVAWRSKVFNFNFFFVWRNPKCAATLGKNCLNISCRQLWLPLWLVHHCSLVSVCVLAGWLAAGNFNTFNTYYGILIIMAYYGFPFHSSSASIVHTLWIPLKVSEWRLPVRTKSVYKCVCVCVCSFSFFCPINFVKVIAVCVC